MEDIDDTEPMSLEQFVGKLKVKNKEIIAEVNSTVDAVAKIDSLVEQIDALNKTIEEASK